MVRGGPSWLVATRAALGDWFLCVVQPSCVARFPTKQAVGRWPEGGVGQLALVQARRGQAAKLVQRCSAVVMRGGEGEPEEEDG